MKKFRTAEIRSIHGLILELLDRNQIPEELQHKAEIAAERLTNLVNHTASSTGQHPLPPETEVAIPDDLLDKISVLTGGAHTQPPQ